MRWSSQSTQVFALCVLLGCSGNPPGNNTSSSSSSGSVDAGSAPDAGSCSPGSVSPLQFADRTGDYGLTDVKGNRLAVADLDEDGYPDLIVHTGGEHRRTNFDAEGGPGSFFYRVLINRPATGGGRRFEEATEASGLFATRSGEASLGRNAQFAIFADLDNDGHLDAFSGTYINASNPQTDPGDRSEVLLGDGHGHFALAPALPASMQGPTAVSSATFIDHDRDGRLDVYVGHWYARYGYGYAGQQNRLLVGSGDGTFLDGTNGAGLTTTPAGFDAFTNHRPTYGVTACDVNGDGEQDLLVSAYGRQLNQLWSNHQALFTDLGIESGYASDGDEDFTTNENYRCYCQLTGACSAPASRIGCSNPPPWYPETDEAKWRLGGNTFTTVCGDFTGDGRMDLYSAEIHHWWAGTNSDSSELLVQADLVDDQPRFTRPGNATTGLVLPHVGGSWNEGGLMAAAADFDHDGRLDVLVGMSDYPDQYGLLFRQKPDGTFEELGAAAGLRHACLSGLAVLDVDRDGDLDVIVGSGTARDCAAVWPNGPEVHLYENVSGQTAHALQLVLGGAGQGGANRSAIGARVTVNVGGKTLVREVQGGYGHAGIQHEMAVDVGLAEACRADVTVRWPNAGLTEQTFVGVRADGRLRLVEGSAVPEPVP